MTEENDTLVTEFILVGLYHYPQAQTAFFWFVLIVYIVTFIGNSLIVMLIVVNRQLNTPMYFFLSNLSFLDICYSSSTALQLLGKGFAKKPTISLSSCLAQGYVSIFLGITESLLLAVMAYDRFAAICKPLQYSLIMNGKVCIHLAAFSWVSAFLLTVIRQLVQPKHFCGHVINHFTCELQAVFKLACSDTSFSELVNLVTALLVLVAPFIFIVVTYVLIGQAVLRIRSAQGRNKALSTCSSHLAAVSIFYGATMFIYLRPQSKSFSDKDKLISVFYVFITPVLNPLIYSIRNKDVQGALKRTIMRIVLC
ncbi:olfactory receptor 13H1-like [Alligator mississippiensis]|uniref:olfactory receptor 13H1-like n=1 Tax=Alligator mississippiensis TaxID=8496 RepID=UPI0003D0EC16|nr:olfactory receptor 13H1-like [Alligator mississippiensis]